jgi:hypothetical protein
LRRRTAVRACSAAAYRLTGRCRSADHEGVEKSIHERLAELHRAGYRSRRVTGEVGIDAEAAARMSCRWCHASRLEFVALSKPGKVGHVALAWCPRCLAVHEI